MTPSEHFFSDVSGWSPEDSGVHRAKKRVLGQREKYAYTPQAWSDDPGQAGAAMARLKKRIVKAVPPGTMYLEALMKIAGYEWTREMESAGITCDAAPTFVFNPEFLDRYCILDTDLRMLILHELHHILYGHHVLCGDMTPAKNVAFDAVVNARLCRALKDTVHADFFRNTYREGGFPEYLLCPPPGWPGETDEHERKQECLRLLKTMDMKSATKVVRLRRRLYESGSDVGYEEVLELLQELGLTKTPRLLGNHVPRAAGKTDYNTVTYPFLLDTARAVHALLNEAERKNGGGNGAGCNGELFNIPVTVANPRRPFLNALRKVLIRAGVYRQHASTRSVRRPAPTERETVSVIPDWRDRTLPARSALLNSPPLLYRSPAADRKPAWTPVGEAHVYLDVSGSMAGDLPWIAGALRPLEKNGYCRIFLFSTKVVPLPQGQLGNGRIASTGGTDIRCVLAHLTELPPAKRPRHAVVVTDGFFGAPYRLRHAFTDFKKAKVTLHGAITPSGSESPLSSIAASITRLPVYK